MKIITTLTTLLLPLICLGQTTSDFENFSLGNNSFLDGSDDSGGFHSGNIFLPNDYNHDYMAWQGWAISNTTDVSTPGWGNQYSVISGSGAVGTATYALTYAFGPTVMHLTGDALGHPVKGFYINNSTYAYLDMLNGGNPGKKFGGPTGNDPDFFKLTIKGIKQGLVTTDSVDFFLADFRFSNNAEDYIVKDWTWVDVASLGAVDSLQFYLSSTDNSPIYGMNTPAYFCIDQVVTSDGISSAGHLKDAIHFSVFPNPVMDRLQVSTLELGDWKAQLFDGFGRLHQEAFFHNQLSWSTRDLPEGMYFLRLTQKEKVVQYQVIKQ